MNQYVDNILIPTFLIRSGKDHAVDLTATEWYAQESRIAPPPPAQRAQKVFCKKYLCRSRSSSHLLQSVRGEHQITVCSFACLGADATNYIVVWVWINSAVLGLLCTRPEGLAYNSLTSLALIPQSPQRQLTNRSPTFFAFFSLYLYLNNAPFCGIE